MSVKTERIANLLVREIGSIEKYKNNNKLAGDYTLNVTNKHTINTFSNLGLSRVCVSPEVKLENVEGSIYNTEILSPAHLSVT